MKNILLLLILLTVQVHAGAPNKHQVDSLKAVLKTSIHDTMRANAYFHLAMQYWDDYPDKSLEYANQIIALSERIGYKRGMAEAYRVLGGVNLDRKKNIDALQWYKKSLNYYRETGNDTLISAALLRTGLANNNVGNVEQALKCYFEALKLDEQRGDSAEAAALYHNIGVIYGATGNNKDAISNIKKALNINKVTGNLDWLAKNYSALGSFISYDNIDESLLYYVESSRLFLSLGNLGGYAFGLVDVGRCLIYIKKYPESIDTLNKALTIFRQIHDKNGIAFSYNHLGMSYTQQGKFKAAAVCLDSCLRLCKELGVPAAMRNVYERLYQLDSASGNFASAFRHYRLHIHLLDSLRNDEHIQIAAKYQLRSEYAKKEELEKAEQEKKDAVQVITRNALTAGFVLVLFLALILYNRFRLKKKANEIITLEKERSENLLLNILPAEVAEELKAKGTAEAKHFDNVTVLFTDFKGFTTISETLSPQELVNELHACFKAFDEICTKYNIEKIKTIGDAYLAVCGLPLADEKHAENVVKAALEIRDFMENRSKEQSGKTFEIRIGINSGSVVAGIVGVKKYAYDIWGDTVNTAARMEQNSKAGKINISETTYELIKGNFPCEYRGEIDAKNKGKLKMYFVEGKT